MSKLFLVILFIHESKPQASLDSFIISNIRTYAMRWPLTPDFTVSINRTLYTLGSGVQKELKEPFNSYIIRYKSNYVLYEPKNILLELKLNSVTAYGSFLIRPMKEAEKCYMRQIGYLAGEFDIFVATDIDGDEHLFSIKKDTWQNFNLDSIFNCSGNFPQNGTENREAVKCFQVFNSQKRSYSQQHFYCLMRYETLNQTKATSLVRICADGRTPHQIVEKMLTVKNKDVTPLFATVIKLKVDTIMYVIYDGNDLFAYRVSDLDKKLTEAVNICLMDEKYIGDCVQRSTNQWCKEKRGLSEQHMKPMIPKISGKVIDMVTFEQEEPIEFNFIVIVTQLHIYVIKVYESKKTHGDLEYITNQINLTLPSTDIKFNFEGNTFRYFDKNAITNIEELGLPCLILDPIHCFLFEKEFGCQYNQNSELCMKNEEQSGIQVIETNRINFTIQPLVAPSLETRKIVIRGATRILYFWMKLKDLLEFKIISTPSDYVQLKAFHWDAKSAILRAKRLKAPALNTSINIKLELKLKASDKTVKIENHATIVLTDPSIIQVQPNYVFTELKNSQFFVNFSADAKDVSKIFFRVNNLTIFRPISKPTVSNNENIFQLFVNLPHHFISPMRKNITLVYQNNVYSEYELEVMEKPVLPEISNAVIFSEAEFNLTWNGTRLKAFYQLSIAVKDSVSSNLVHGECNIHSTYSNVTCAYPKLLSINETHQTYLFFYSHQTEIETGSPNRVTYLPAPSDIYAYTTNKEVRLTGSYLHYTYPIDIVLTKRNDNQTLKCSGIEYVSNYVSSKVEFICFLNETLQNSQDWALTLLIGKWSISSIDIKLAPKTPTENAYSFRTVLFSILLIVALFISVVLAVTFVMKSTAKSKMKVDVRKLVLQSYSDKRKEKAIRELDKAKTTTAKTTTAKTTTAKTTTAKTATAKMTIARIIEPKPGISGRSPKIIGARRKKN